MALPLAKPCWSSSPVKNTGSHLSLSQFLFAHQKMQEKKQTVTVDSSGPWKVLSTRRFNKCQGMSKEGAFTRSGLERTHHTINDGLQQDSQVTSTLASYNLSQSQCAKPCQPNNLPCRCSWTRFPVQGSTRSTRSTSTCRILLGDGEGATPLQLQLSKNH